MLDKQITYSDEARQKIKAGVDKLANAVRVTLGPKGRNVILDRGYNAPVVTKDGVTVAKEVFLKDKLENLGATLVKNVAAKTAEIAGDGTTTATVLAQSMVEHGMRLVTTGANPQSIRRGMEMACKKLVEAIKDLATPVEDNETIRHVASISANDPVIGGIIAEAMRAVGKDGVVTVEESRVTGVTLDITQGLEIDKGYISPYLVTDQERMEAVHENPYILITDQKIMAGITLKPIVEKIAASSEGLQPLLIIADDVQHDALQTLIINTRTGSFKCLAIKAPSFGDRRRDVLDDIAVLTGGKFLAAEQGFKVETAEVADLGRARRVISTSAKTTIIDGAGSKESIETRIKMVKRQLEEAETEYDKEKHRERIAQLAGSIACVKVGAASETEMIEKKHRIEDAVAATKAAVEEGIVPGGGTVQYLATLDLAYEGSDENESAGFQVVMKAMRSPLRYIVENAGQWEHMGVIIQEIVNSANEGWGWDAEKGEMCDLIERGIIDPAKVTRVALENAVSAAIMILTTEAAITDASTSESEKKEE